MGKKLLRAASGSRGWSTSRAPRCWPRLPDRDDGADGLAKVAVITSMGTTMTLPPANRPSYITLLSGGGTTGR